METTIIFQGRGGQIVFFDEKDKKCFSWVLSLLPYHMRNDLKTYERCGRALRWDFTSKTVTVILETWEWSAEQIAKFVCMCYDSYFRRRYKCEGKQLEYSIT